MIFAHSWPRRTRWAGRWRPLRPSSPDSADATEVLPVLELDGVLAPVGGRACRAAVPEPEPQRLAASNDATLVASLPPFGVPATGLGS